ERNQVGSALMRLGEMLLHRTNRRATEEADERVDRHGLDPWDKGGGKYTDRPRQLPARRHRPVMSCMLALSRPAREARARSCGAFRRSSLPEHSATDCR